MASGNRTRVALGLALLFTAAVAARAGAAVWLVAGGRAAWPDSPLYIGYAKALHDGSDYRIGEGGARRTPGYPLFIAAAWRMAFHEPSAFGDAPPDLLPILVLQTLVGAAQAPLAWLLALRLGFSGTAAWIAAGLAAFDPLNVALSGMILTETAAATALLAAAACWAGRGRWTEALGAGACAAAALLVRPSVLPLFLAAWALRRWPWRAKLLAGLAFAALWAPWIVRNHRVYGRFVPTTLNTGESLYDGWSPIADGGSNMKFVAAFDPPGATWQEREINADAHWRNEAWAWAKQNPAAAVRLGFEKLRRYWSPIPNANEFRSAWANLGGAAWHVPVFALAAWGTVACFRERRGAAWFLWAPALAFMALHLVFVSSIRYRAPAAPYLDVLAGVGAAALRRRPPA